MRAYYDKCSFDIREANYMNVDSALRVILDGGELLRSDGSAFENTR